MVVVNDQSAAFNQLSDELIEVPFSVIRLTMSGQLRRTIDELGSELFEKFEKE